MIGTEAGDTTGNFLQYPIASLVACQTIQRLEIIETEHQNGLFRSTVVRIAEMAVQLLFEQASIGKAGKLIIEGPDLQFLLGSAQGAGSFRKQLVELPIKQFQT